MLTWQEISAHWDRGVRQTLPAAPHFPGNAHCRFLLCLTQKQRYLEHSATMCSKYKLHAHLWNMTYCHLRSFLPCLQKNWTITWSLPVLTDIWHRFTLCSIEVEQRKSGSTDLKTKRRSLIIKPWNNGIMCSPNFTEQSLVTMMFLPKNEKPAIPIYLHD